jgi:hypothetical protein
MCVCVCVHVCVYVYGCVRMCVYMCVYGCVCVYVYVSVWVWVWVWVWVCVFFLSPPSLGINWKSSLRTDLALSVKNQLKNNSLEKTIYDQKVWVVIIF